MPLKEIKSNIDYNGKFDFTQRIEGHLSGKSIENFNNLFKKLTAKENLANIETKIPMH